MKNLTTIARLAHNGADLRDWYSVAWRELQAFPEPGRIAEALAVTSPRVQLTRNVKLARLVVAGIMPSGILPGVKVSILNWWKTGEITGKKTSAFARCLQGCSDSGSLCLDVWMARAFDVPQEKLFRSDILDRITRTMQRLATRNNWTIVESQAAVWAGALREKNRTANYFPIHLLKD